MEQENKTQEQKSQEPTTVGMFLKYTRQNQKKSVETVAKALCIRKIYIKAIEESDFNELPPIPYGIGFVRSYADYLGLNVERIVQCYKEEALPKKNDGNSKPIVSKHTSLTIPNRKQILIGVFLVLALYALAHMFVFASNEEDIKTNIVSASDENIEFIVEDVLDAPLQEPIIEEQVTEAQEAEIKEDTVSVVEESYQEEEETPVQVVEQKNKVLVKFRGESWFELKDDNKVYISGIYQKGFEYEIPDVPGLIFSVGRYYNVDVFINDELVKVAGPKKQTNIELDNFLKH